MALHSNLLFPLHLHSSKSSTLAPLLSNPSSFPSRLPWPLPRFPGVKIAPKEQKHWSRIRVSCDAKTEAENESLGVVKEKSISVVLLAGGKGKRMGVSMPKQYIPLLGQPIALYSFFTFSQLSEVKEIVVVCDPSYKDVFEDASEEIQVDLKFASPGKERQDSVFNGFQEIDGSSELVCIHDSARPLVSSRDIEKVLKDGLLNGAAVLGVPVKATIKEASNPESDLSCALAHTVWRIKVLLMTLMTHFMTHFMDRIRLRS